MPVPPPVARRGRRCRSLQRLRPARCGRQMHARRHIRIPARRRSGSCDGRSIAVVARAQQDAVWRRTKAGNELRSLLREYYPGFLATFARKSATNLARPETREILILAPTPADALKLTKTRVAAALRRVGRQRGIEASAAEIIEGLRAPLNQGPARQHYQRRRAAGSRHTAALRHLFDKMLGQLHHRLLSGQPYDPIKAFGPSTDTPLTRAAA